MAQVTVLTQTTIANLYISILGRNPEPAGFGFWVDRLANNGNTTAAAADIARGFADSPEFIGTYGGLTPTAAITLMYNNVLNRAPDAGGLAFWVGQADALRAAGNSVGDSYALTGAAIITTAGTNSSSDTALIVAKQTAAIASGTGSGGSGQTFTLTTNIETINAANGDVNGVINGAVGTFQTGDIINNAKNVNVTVAAPSGEANGPLVALNNVETATFRNVVASGSPATPINAILYSGVGTLAVNGSTSVLAVNSGALATTYRVANTVAASVDGIAVGIRAGDVTGTTSTANFSVSNAGTASTAAAGVSPNVIRSILSTTTTGIENIAIATAGTNNFTVNGNTTAATDSVLLTITGAGTNNINVADGGLATTSTITAATATGNLTLNVNAGLTTGDTIVGTAGTSDTLQANISGVTATGLAVSGIETLRISAVGVNGNGGTIAFATNPGLTTVRVDASAATSTQVGTVNQLLSAGGFTNLNFVGNSVTASAITPMFFNGVTATGGYTGTADTLTVNLSNGGVALTAGGAYTVGNITTSGVEAYVVNVNDQTANTNTTTIARIQDATMNSLTLNSVGNVVLTNVGNIAGTAGVNGNLTAINFAGVTGTNDVSTVSVANNSLAAAVLVTAGAGGLTLAVGAETATDVLTFTGGIGVDILNANAGGAAGIDNFRGIIVANGGAGADVFNIGGAGAAAVGTGAASATITGGTGADTFNFNNGAGINLVTDLGLGATLANNESIAIDETTAVTATVAANLITSGGGAADNFAYSVADASSLTLNLASTVTSVELATTAGAVGVTVSAALGAAATTIVGSGFTDTITGSAFADIITGGGAGAAGTAQNVDIINGGLGIDTYIYANAAASTVGGGAAAAATGFDLVTVTAGDRFSFTGVAVAGAVALEATIANPANAFGDTLLAALDAAWQASAAVNGGAYLVQTLAGAQYLMVDINGDGDITVADNVIQIVGTATGISVVAGQVVIA